MKQTRGVYVLDTATDAAVAVSMCSKGMAAEADERAAVDAVVRALAEGMDSGEYACTTAFSVGTNAGGSVGRFRWRLRGGSADMAESARRAEEMRRARASDRADDRWRRGEGALDALRAEELAAAHGQTDAS
jgi:hypothetical protein